MTKETKRSDARHTGKKPADTKKQSAREAQADEKKPAPRNRERRKTTAHPNVRVWRGDRDANKRPSVKEEKSEAPTADESKVTTGRKLWLKVGDSGKVKQQKPPAGHEKHHDLTSYRAEEQEEQRRIVAELRQKRKLRARTQIRPKPQPTPPAEKAPEPEQKATPIEAVYTIGLYRTSPQKFMQKLVDAGISLVFDLRSDEAMFAPGFAKDRDLAILLKEAAGIEYRRDEVLVPRRELVQRFVSDKNSTRYAQNYAYQLSRGRVEKIIDRDLFVKHKVAFIGETKKGENDQRHIAAEHLKERWGIYSIVEL